MSENSELRPIHQSKPISSTYCDPVLIKEGTVSRLFRVSRAGKYFIVKTTKDGSSAQMELIRREYELSIALNHPYIVSVFTFEEATPVGAGIVMEYIDGVTLTEFLAQNPSKKLRQRTVEQLLDAVAYLHRKGVVHNDLKPENILISRVDNTLKIIDFGLSDNDAYFLYKGLGCTPKYASPELLAHQQTDCRSDIYSLGLIARDVLGERYKRVWKKAASEQKGKRYANVEQLKKALTAGRNVALAGIVFLIVIAVIASFFIRKVEYHETITYFQDTLALESLQMKNDSLQMQLDVFQKEKEESLAREQYIDSICRNIDKKLQNMYESMLIKCQNITYRESCYSELAKTAEDVHSLWYSYQDQIYDNGMLSQIKVYYDSIFDKLHRRALSVLDAKPLSPEFERLQSHTPDCE